MRSWTDSGALRRLNADFYDLSNIARGMSNEEIVDYMVARYGDFVRYRPPGKATTFILWFGPVLLLIAALVLLVRRVRSRASTASDDTLSEADRARAHALLAGEEERK